MQHALEREYGLTAYEILEAISHHFRAKVALEGVVSETILAKKLAALLKRGKIEKFSQLDEDGKPDFLVWVHNGKQPISIECKNVRDTDEAYRENGKIVAYKVETQKTRAARGDHRTRYYDIGYFDVLAVCLGKKTGSWLDFLFIRSTALPRHSLYSDKLAVMHRVPLPTSSDLSPWTKNLEESL